MKQLQDGKYELLMLDDFNEDTINQQYWGLYYLPQWSSKEMSQPSYKLKDSVLTLYLADNQMPWCQEWNGPVRVSNLQTGVFSGAVGTSIGQHHFTKGLVVREEQEKDIKVAPYYGYIELRAKCHISKENVAALWMIGTEVKPEESAEICIFELKGWNVKEESAIIGYGLHPFGDLTLKDHFYEEEFDVKVTEWNTYGVDWKPESLDFYINGTLVRQIKMAPDYPMQLMLNLYDLEHKKNETNTFEIDYVKVYQWKNS